MKSISISIAMMVLTGIGVNAQKKISFSSQTFAGTVTGEYQTELQLQTINGIKINKWFGGIGTGIDWYYLRSIPVFVSANRDLLQKGKKTLLLSADAGINFPWEEQYYYSFDYNGSNKQYPGLYWAAGLGYRFGVGKADNALLLNFGYSYKQQKEKVSNISNIIVLCFNPPCTPNVESFDYRLKRLSVRIGWSF
jgi:hypothetical protein